MAVLKSEAPFPTADNPDVIHASNYAHTCGKAFEDHWKARDKPICYGCWSMPVLGPYHICLTCIERMG